MNETNIQILNDTLHSCEKGSYRYNGKAVKLKLTHKEQKACEVLLPVHGKTEAEQLVD